MAFQSKSAINNDITLYHKFVDGNFLFNITLRVKWDASGNVTEVKINNPLLKFSDSSVYKTLKLHQPALIQLDGSTRKCRIEDEIVFEIELSISDQIIYSFKKTGRMYKFNDVFDSKDHLVIENILNKSRDQLKPRQYYSAYLFKTKYSIKLIGYYLSELTGTTTINDNCLGSLTEGNAQTRF